MYARVAELVDALASGVSVSNDVEVQVLSRAPKKASLYRVVFFVYLFLDSIPLMLHSHGHKCGHFL